ncbi:hypothetical protein Hamer_G024888 [Homarus americanus]|uniref:Uncharacterized protein n=1 Tax=Homarus americanus TaxID=6706 RepID=A0A8J5JY03_HOMAM|nr:hypothetical protein Hamer_G024888 [Homarus americanus]
MVCVERNITTDLISQEDAENVEDKNQETNISEQKGNNPPESPPIDRSSVRSSGYGSKETDSVSERSEGHDEDDLLGAEVETALRSTPAPPAFSDQKPSLKEGAAGRGNKTTPSVAETSKPVEVSASSGNETPTVILAGGKPVATIVTQHPQFVRGIEVNLRRAKSLETLGKQRMIQNLGSTTVPRPIWPRVGSLVGDLPQTSRRGSDPLQHVQEFPNSQECEPQRVPSPVDILKQDFRYVTSIDVTPLRPLSRAKTFNPGHPNPVPGSANTPSQLHLQDGIDGNSSITRYFGDEHHRSGYPLMSLQPDSLVTEDTLRMMRYGREDDLEEEDYESPIQVTEKRNSAPLPDFSQATYTRGLYATLNRAASLSSKDIIKPYKTRSKSFDIAVSNHKSCAKKRGLIAVKDLWEKSGLKTNGRKLIVNVDDLLDQSEEDPSRRLSEGSSVEQLRSFSSTVVNEGHLHRLPSDNTTSTNATSNTYEELNSFETKDTTSHPSLETNPSGSYAEIGDVVLEGIDNPAFLDDSGRPRYPSPPPIIHHNGKPLMPANRFLDPDKLAAFQKKISEKLQGAPLHRMQWLDLDDIVVEDFEDNKQERRVKFTADTVNPGSLERGVGGSHRGARRSPPLPGGALKIFHDDDVESMEGRRLQEVITRPMNQEANDTDHKGIWAISESYRDRFQSPGTCHDFTLDLRRSAKLRRRSVARKKRRRCYAIILLILAISVFVGVVVAVSLYYTKGEKFFGPM